MCFPLDHSWSGCSRVTGARGRIAVNRVFPSPVPVRADGHHSSPLLLGRPNCVISSLFAIVLSFLCARLLGAGVRSRRPGLPASLLPVGALSFRAPCAVQYDPVCLPEPAATLGTQGHDCISPHLAPLSLGLADALLSLARGLPLVCSKPLARLAGVASTHRVPLRTAVPPLGPACCLCCGPDALVFRPSPLVWLRIAVGGRIPNSNTVPAYDHRICRCRFFRQV